VNAVQKVLVVGGGVGGLTAATAMAQRGIHVILIEKRPAFDVPGVGLGQPANALRVYRDLGVLDEVIESGFSYNSMHVFDNLRQHIAAHDFLLGDADTPAVCALSRSRLHDILYAAAVAAGVEIRLGTTVRAMDETPNAVHVTFSQGTTDVFDVVAGFDGVRSTTREYLFGGAFVPRPSGFGAWRFQVTRPDCVQGMEFLQGIGGKTGAMPLANDLMYLFHIRREEPGAVFDKADYVGLLQERMAQYGSYVAEARDNLTDDSGIVYSPLEPMLLPWPWHRGRVVIGGDAAHTFPPHLTQGAAMAAEDALVLADELALPDKALGAKLDSYARRRYARCAFVYSFSKQWLEDEQSVMSPVQMEAARAEMSLNLSTRIAASDRILNEPIIGARLPQEVSA
jgi:2-polyprenyl-6-methoxyphenol hydroxylase-like FAD-dependent oxidoreductase